MESRPVIIEARLLITRFDEVHQLARDNIENSFHSRFIHPVIRYG